MLRALLPGRWNRHGRAIPLNACTGNCNQGRSCTCDTELASTHAPSLELVVSRPAVRWQTSGGRIPRARRVRRFFRALFRFLTASRCEL